MCDEEIQPEQDLVLKLERMAYGRFAYSEDRRVWIQASETFVSTVALPLLPLVVLINSIVSTDSHAF